jgi:hypothetical protein
MGACGNIFVEPKDLSWVRNSTGLQTIEIHPHGHKIKDHIRVTSSGQQRRLPKYEFLSKHSIKASYCEMDFYIIY